MIKPKLRLTAAVAFLLALGILLSHACGGEEQVAFPEETIWNTADFQRQDIEADCTIEGVYIVDSGQGLKIGFIFSSEDMVPDPESEDGFSYRNILLEKAFPTLEEEAVSRVALAFADARYLLQLTDDRISPEHPLLQQMWFDTERGDALVVDLTDEVSIDFSRDREKPHFYLHIAPAGSR